MLSRNETLRDNKIIQTNYYKPKSAQISATTCVLKVSIDDVEQLYIASKGIFHCV